MSIKRNNVRYVPRFRKGQFDAHRSEKKYTAHTVATFIGWTELEELSASPVSGESGSRWWLFPDLV